MTGTAAGVIMLLIGIAMLGGGIVVVVFAGKAMAAAQDPDITMTNSATGQSAPVGRSGLLFFIVLGLLLAAGGIGLVVSGIRAFTAASPEASTGSASGAATASAGHKPGDAAKHKARHTG